MREFAITLRYRDGVDRLMDEFIAAPEAAAISTTCCVTANAMWRVDTLRGPESRLPSILDAYLDESWCNECLKNPPCESHRRYDLVEERPGLRSVYGYREELRECRSIPYLAIDRYGEGVLFETNRRGNEYRWRIVLPREGKVGALYDAIDDRLRDGIELELRHVGACEGWKQTHPLPRELAPEQVEALATAVDAGYYETPRETTVADLAAAAGVPDSTFQHRLQRAEGAVLASALGRWRSAFGSTAGARGQEPASGDD